MTGIDPRISAADVADFLEKGLLENLVLLFRSEPSLYPLLGELLRDERIGVRLGTTALVESLAVEDPDGRTAAAESLLPLLRDPSPTVRGDAAYLLGIVGGSRAVRELEKSSDDDNGDVREIVQEALEEIAKT